MSRRWPSSPAWPGASRAARDVGASSWSASALLTGVAPVRRGAASAASRVWPAPLGGFDSARGFERLASTRTWLVALSTSLVAWVLPGVALWLLVASVGATPGLVGAEQAYAASSLRAGPLARAGGHCRRRRASCWRALTAIGLTAPSAVLTVLGIRLATVGVSTLLGLVFVLLHVRTARRRRRARTSTRSPTPTTCRFPSRAATRCSATKTELMREVIERRGLGDGVSTSAADRARTSRGCASWASTSPASTRRQGRSRSPPARRRSAGSSSRLGAAASRHPTRRTISSTPSTCCTISRRSTSSGARSARCCACSGPAALLFVHEINTRNILFRFYMGYVFPSLNCIDEGVERWLLPHRLAEYTSELATVEIRYFTFLPDFLPGRSCAAGAARAVARALAAPPVLRALHGGARRSRHEPCLIVAGRVFRRSRSPSGSCRPRSTSSSGRFASASVWRTCRRSPSSLASRWRSRWRGRRAAGASAPECRRRRARSRRAPARCGCSGSGPCRTCRGCRIACRCCWSWPGRSAGCIAAARRGGWRSASIGRLASRSERSLAARRGATHGLRRQPRRLRPASGC